MKRKIEQMESSDTEDDVYDDIKRLYNEEPDNRSCAMMQASQDNSNNGATNMQRVANWDKVFGFICIHQSE